MDIRKLLEPYSEGGIRTIEGQVKWLQSKGVPQNYIDQAVLVVYDEMERGRVYENGHELDRFLFETTQRLQKAELEAGVKKLEDYFNSFKGKWREEEFNKRTLWQRIKEVFRPIKNGN